LLFNWRNKIARKLLLEGKGAGGRTWPKNSHPEILSYFSGNNKAYLSGTTVFTPEAVDIFCDIFSPAMCGKNMLKTSCQNVTRQA
jgi:hypothetical protein